MAGGGNNPMRDLQAAWHRCKSATCGAGSLCLDEGTLVGRCTKVFHGLMYEFAVEVMFAIGSALIDTIHDKPLPPCVF
jgi:hypothetical protein